MKYLLFIVSSLLVLSCNDSQKKIEKENALDELGALKADIAAHPDSLLLQEELIQYYREKNQYNEAIAMANTVLAKDSTIARFWFIRGTLLLENEDSAAALLNLKRAAEIYPTEEHLVALGNLYAVQKNASALAIADYLGKNPQLKSPRNIAFMKGLYYSYSGNKKEAIKHFNDCLAISYTDMDAYLEKGVALYDLGKFMDAKDVFIRATTLQNNFDQGHYYLGKTYEKLGNKESAADAYRMALMYDKDYTEAREGLKRVEQ